VLAVTTSNVLNVLVKREVEMF